MSNVDEVMGLADAYRGAHWLSHSEVADRRAALESRLRELLEGEAVAYLHRDQFGNLHFSSPANVPADWLSVYATPRAVDVDAISDEVSCYDGGTAYLTHEGLLTNDCDDEECPHFAKIKSKARTIRAIWGSDVSWKYETDIPHATFQVIDDGDVYCHGIVFALADCHTASTEK